MLFGRLMTAMITPFTKDHAIDWVKQAEVIDHLITTGNDTIVVAGTTAESPNLSHDEKLQLFQFTLEKVAGRVKVIAGTGSNNTTQTIQLTKEAEALGVDGVMLVAPFYNKPSQEGLFQHFKTVAEATKLPIMLYNVPGRTGVNMTAETMARLAELENVVAIKEASGNLSQIANLISMVPDDIAVYSGDDALTLPILSVGGAGVVSVASHVLGREIKETIEAYFAGNVAHAARLFRKYLPVFEGIFFTSSPVPIKYALSKKGLCEPTVRLPLVELDEQQVVQAQSWLQLIP
ncbi:4-hydroxy-tetrahydrodipicolinate synthase [Thermoflavimicrobium daqui]|jgi:4-hydroxy-tetrahydrodipicolinate synthase|uniref:4-hydroxy-tetrahydrodipicolinate synthase n=1 Tax=Thermoflavimicrobium daqui TaxID=2137476 RepID=A0A364K7U2_9BACL|nr:4-hydroxy-tetrahydrodipicolinate synthase [Thermoflavimicrobium daqui]RAL26348.1 4-hydroxy-tetrahydrodipicolinate synthase [Thermoflavimicrobium daqui]